MVEKNKFFLGSPPEKTIQGLDYSKMELVKPIKISEKEIAKGGFGKIYYNLYKIIDNDKEIELVKKEFEYKLNHDEIKDLFDKYNRMKDADMDVLKIYTDGKDLYSENLNKDGKIALSWNNDLKNEKEDIYEKIKDSIEIKNINEVIHKIFIESAKSKDAGVIIPQDALFYLVNEDNEKKQNIDFIVGDYDMIEEGKIGDYNIALKTLANNLNSFKKFIDKYAKEGKKQEYFNEINKAMNFDFINEVDDDFGENGDVISEVLFFNDKYNDKILTQNGLKNISEYTEEDFVFKEIFSPDSDKNKVLEIINDKYNKNFSIDQIVFNKNEINEKTRLFVGDLSNGDAEILNNRKEPLMIAGQVYFIGDKEIEKIPDNFEVTERALFDRSNLKEIGNNVTFHGQLSLNNLGKIKISDNLQANKIEMIDTFVSDDDLKKLEEMKKEGKIYSYIFWDDEDMDWY